jgi:hypothetical protein
MRRFWPVFAIPALLLALATLVGVLRHDALSATPGKVVEDFLRGVVHERYEKAISLLTVEGSGSKEELSRWKRSVEDGLGKVKRVRGETEWISGEEAEATGVLVAERRERRLRFGLEREGGRWRIARLDEFWGESEAAGNAADPSSVPIREGWRLSPARRR